MASTSMTDKDIAAKQAAKQAEKAKPDVEELDPDSPEVDDLVNVDAMRVGGVPSVLSESIEGGAFLGADGRTWHDAEGRPLNPAAVAAAKQHAAKQKETAASMQKEIDDGLRRRVALHSVGLQ